MTTNQNLRREVRDGLARLAQPAAGEHLLNLCLDAVQTVDERRLRDAARVTAPLRPQMLLTLLTFSYARGLYDSRDIAAAAGNDRTLRYICAGARPLWTDLRRFRREHRDLVAGCLAWLLQQAWAFQFDEGETSFLGYEWFETELSALIDAETRTRLETAALLDSSDGE